MNQIVEWEKSESRRDLSQREQLQQFTKVVADTGDFASLRQDAPSSSGF